MATSKVSTKKNSKSVEKSAAITAPVRAAKPRAPRVTSVKHSKATVSEVTPETVRPETVRSETVTSETVVQAARETPHEAIAKIAYGYWRARGYQSGDPVADWLRAEAEYRKI
jgi:hypothetical protein